MTENPNSESESAGTNHLHSKVTQTVTTVTNPPTKSGRQTTKTTTVVEYE